VLRIRLSFILKLSAGGYRLAAFSTGTCSCTWLLQPVRVKT